MPAVPTDIDKFSKVHVDEEDIRHFQFTAHNELCSFDKTYKMTNAPRGITVTQGEVVFHVTLDPAHLGKLYVDHWPGGSTRPLAAETIWCLECLTRMVRDYIFKLADAQGIER